MLDATVIAIQLGEGAWICDRGSSFGPALSTCQRSPIAPRVETDPLGTFGGQRAELPREPLPEVVLRARRQQLLQVLRGPLVVRPIMSLVAHEARSAFRAPHQIAASPVVPADSGRRERRASRPRDVPLLVGQVSRYFVHTSAP